MNAKEFSKSLPKPPPEPKPVSIVDLHDLGLGEALFYPAGGFDVEPVRRLTHLFRTFVFSNYSEQESQWNPDRFTDANHGLVCNHIARLSFDTVAQLTDRTEMPVQPPNGLQMVPPWGKIFQVTRTVANEQRQLQVLFLGIEGATAYWNLFAKRQLNAKGVCLNLTLGQNWARFQDWNGPLGTLVQRNRPLPTYLVADTNCEGDWPMNLDWQHLGGWCHSVRIFVEPRRIVRLRKESLIPGNAGDVDAVFTHGHIPAAWPAGIQLLMNATELHPWARQIVPEPILCRLTGAPMKVALQTLTAVCEARQIKKVACIGFGFEDEGPELEVWRRELGYPLEITIYCPNDGDVLSLGPYADSIE